MEKCFCWMSTALAGSSCIVCSKKKKKRTKENEISSNEQVRRFAKVKQSKSAAVLSVKLS